MRLIPALERFVPPARVLDKHVYAPWTEGQLDARLSGSDVDTLVITGGETDVCVLASAFGGIDRGFRVVLVGDALCSFIDETHDALKELYPTRFTKPLEVETSKEILINLAIAKSPEPSGMLRVAPLKAGLLTTE